MFEDAGVGRKKNVHLSRKEGWKGTETQISRVAPTGEVEALAAPSIEN